jgi:hypothetical protein
MAAPLFELQFFHDEDESRMVIRDFKMLTRLRGIGIGTLFTEQREKPMGVVTSDGGKTWTLQPIPDDGVSLFFLNDSLGWMVSEGGIYRTDEGGRSWTRISRQKRLLRVWFTSPERGYAVGINKTVLATVDGGKKWTEVVEAQMPNSEKRETSYFWLQFPNPQRGLIVGHVAPERSSDPHYPVWMDPSPGRRREWPSLTIFLQTIDGGKTWKASTTSMFGRLIRFLPYKGTRQALGLLDFERFFTTPSEVILMDNADGKAKSVFNRKDRRITDIWVSPEGTVYLAGVESLGMLGGIPAPSKVKVFRSRDLAFWEEIEVDYRATATRVTLSGISEYDVWLATDTGMVLRLGVGEPGS